MQKRFAVVLKSQVLLEQWCRARVRCVPILAARIFVFATGDHKLEVLVDGKLEGGADFSRTERFTIHKEVKPKLVGLTLAGSSNTPIAIGEW